jgi:hypothetical protein
MGLSENESRAFIVLKNSLVNLGGCLQVQTALLAGFTGVSVFDMHAKNTFFSCLYLEFILMKLIRNPSTVKAFDSSPSW